MRNAFALPAGVIMVLISATGCTMRGPERIDEQNPTVAYSYQYGEVDEVKQDAAKYCYENYGRSARVIDDVQSGGERVVTFECVITPR